MRDEKKRGRMNAERGMKNSSAFSVQHSAFPRIPPKKRFGQNFLADERVVERIIEEVSPRADETIVEIGSGRGALTSALVEKAGRLVAVEYDRDLVPLLREKFGARENFILIEADALAIDLCDAIAPATQARVVANLPYYISTAILQRLIEQRACLTEMILMLQREVVERICAPPASSGRGFLSVLVEAYCEAETLFDVAPTSFRPVPKVWSSVVRLRLRRRIAIDLVDENLLWRIVSAGFAQRRKTIFNNLRHAPAELLARIEKAGGAERVLEGAGVVPQRRAETLTLEEWGRVTRVLEAS
jgi:16S rRNA (adenine1518-N6/adenine1519-N6)-dimethyltransferase